MSKINPVGHDKHCLVGMSKWVPTGHPIQFVPFQTGASIGQVKHLLTVLL